MRMLCAILNKSRKQQPTKQQLDGHLPPISMKDKQDMLGIAGEAGTNL